MNQVDFYEWPVGQAIPGPAFKIGVVRLNNPKALNSLTLSMVEDCGHKLLQWENDASVVAVVFYSDLEKAFCAGGDVKAVVQNLSRNDPGNYVSRFFRWEYKMDYTLQTFSKPVLSWGDGIVMGGGMGIFCASSHRVVTERSILAMPEISIGFFPDVGASYFLNKLPRPVALFLAWTAARLNPTDALNLNLAQYHVPSSVRTEFFEALRNLPWTGSSKTDSDLLSIALRTVETKSEIASELAPAQGELDEIFDSSSSPQALAEEFSGAKFNSPWLALGQKNFRAGSPTSALVAFEQLGRASKMPVLDIFVMEWNLARQMCERKDFREGVRARLIDKDNAPRWSPSSFREIGPELVESHFDPFNKNSESQETIRAFFSNRRV